LLVAGGVNFAVRMVKTMPETPALGGFLTRVVGRPSFAAYLAADRALQPS
jgi:hypothetical protein